MRINRQGNQLSEAKLCSDKPSHPLPPYSPELNPVENVWAYLRGNKLSNRVFESYEAIVDACSDA